MTSLRSFSILITAIILFLLGNSVIIYLNLKGFADQADRLEHSSQSLKEIESILSTIEEAQSAHRGFALTGDSSFFNSYEGSKLKISQTIGTLEKVLIDDEDAYKKLDTLQSLISAQFQIIDSFIAQYRVQRQIGSEKIISLKSEEENMAKIMDVVQRMRKAEEIWLVSKNAFGLKANRIAPIFILLSFIAAVVALGFLFIQLYRTIRVKVATEGELEQNLKLLSEEVNEKELAQQSLQKVLDSTTNGVIFFKAERQNGKIVDLHIILANEQTKEILGAEREELEGNTVLNKYPGTQKIGLYDKYVEVIEKDQSLDVEFYYDYDGLNKWFHLTANKLEDGCVVSFADISQRKRYEEELIRKNEALLESNRNLEQFAYVASHDLQEPLRKIRTFSDRVVTKYKDKLDDKGKDYIDRMNGAAERMQSLIDDLLKFSRISMPSKEIQEVDLNQLIDTIALDFETLFDDRNVNLKVSGLENIRGDKTQLRQLFQNLISNAIKFTPSDRSPKISISGERVTGKQQRDFNINSNEQFLRIEVTDNGIGFDQKYAERIFNIFERLHGKSEIKGTGIGLAVCHKVVKNHQGFIKAVSEEDKGAKFIILLPLKPI